MNWFQSFLQCELVCLHVVSNNSDVWLVSCCFIILLTQGGRTPRIIVRGEGGREGVTKNSFSEKVSFAVGRKKVKIVFKLIQKCEVFCVQKEREGKEVRNESVALSHSSTFLLFCHRLSVCLSVCFLTLSYLMYLFFCLSDLLYVMFVCFTSLFMFNTHTFTLISSTGFCLFIILHKYIYVTFCLSLCLFILLFFS
jgi:hypothetical protein